MPIPRSGQEMQLATASVQVLIQDVEKNVRSGAVAGCTIFARGTFCPQSVCLADKLCFCPRERPVILSKPTDKNKPHRAVHDWS